MLSSTRLGRHFNLSSVKMNLILAELGWVEKYVKGWVPTDAGNALGANVREMRNGTPYVVWPESILANKALGSSVGEQTGGGAALTAEVATAPEPEAACKPEPPSADAAREADPAKRATANGKAAPTRAGAAPLATPVASTDASADFRTRFPATFRTQDGHMVRSRAEVLIDNWLYMQGLVHAYERRLPIEEECYCDFYLPGGHGTGGKGVYIEFWGRESDPAYRARKAKKQAIYAKHGMRLIELGDAEIERLDDVLPRMLLRFGIESV
ncbi:hypothetical protein [Humisphaera borealis]|uniref:Glycerol kinase n=1 Tax=Humisphaera borealis TaxID=2807512 RepID=A0A7M2X286_9BACT|nr:hypothetical protein [Humisphaera borealis]QOV91833.1 glycerol kinase [Humisphaera borealis]